MIDVRITKLLIAVLLCVSSLNACMTDAGETTTVAAATGGALGAGLGAVVGNQTGSTGEGLVIGAAAGAATGAILGNMFEAQEEAIQTQDEALERQEQMIRTQRAELDELRRMSQDNVSFKPKPRRHNSSKSNTDKWSSGGSANRNTTSSKVIEDTPTTVGVDTRARFAGGESRAKASDSVIERDIPAAAPDAVSSRAQKVQDNVNLVGLRDEERSISANFSSPECVQAMQESGKGQAVTAMSDKLFHFRRALRLCPNNPVFHNRLGEVYLSLTRNADAEYEFRQALSLEPEFKIAQNNLDRVTTIR